MKTIFSLILFFIPFITHARLVQIIHTNDLHSYFEGYKDGRGSYARVMTKIKELRAEAEAKGIEVLQLDAGDWGEGTSYFLSENGSDSIRALEMLGTEIAAIGNHDHLLGGNVLGKQIRAANVKTKFAIANLQQTPDMELGDTVSPYVDIEKAGIPIRVIGLTTNERAFQYSVAPGKVLNPVPIGEEQGKAAKAAGKELVIALTHIGLYQDKALGISSSSIDVIIGGHTHTKLQSIETVKNKKGIDVPIVQAWAHGLAVGSLLLDVKEGGGVKVVEYKMHEVTNAVTPDESMEAFVKSAGEKRNENLTFNADEVIGETKTPMTGYKDGRPVFRSSCWGRHIATAARQAAKASVGIHLSNFEGVYKDPGPITYADIADNFPHIRKYGDQGWEIASVLVSGLKLRALMFWISRRGYGVSFSGLGYKSSPGNKSVMTVNEDEIDDKGSYRVAFPAEIVLGIKASFPEYRHYLQGLKYSGQYYWPVMVDYIRKNSPIRCN